MLEPDVTLNAIALVYSGFKHVRIAPLVPIKQSTYGASFGNNKSSLSNPAVLPIKYPWSKANITVFPLFGLKIFAK